MIGRSRACVAILRAGHVLMVLHRQDGRDDWSLPGGGVEPGETPDQAAMRETLEECGLAVKIVRLLFTRDYIAGLEYTFLAEIIGDEITYPGLDSEPQLDTQWLQEVRWQLLENVKDDIQISLLLQTIHKHD